MLQRALILPPMQLASLLGPQDGATALTNRHERRCVDLVLGHQVGLAELAAQVVARHGVAEGQGRGGLLAEDHHVGEVGGVGVADFFAEDAA